MMHRLKKGAFFINVCCWLMRCICCTYIVIVTVFKGSKNRPQKLPQKVCVCVTCLCLHVCIAVCINRCTNTQKYTNKRSRNPPFAGAKLPEICETSSQDRYEYKHENIWPYVVNPNLYTQSLVQDHHPGKQIT